MKKPTRVIRHEVYDFIEAKGITLTSEELGFLSFKIQEHQDNKLHNYKDICKKYEYTEMKVNQYLKKAETVRQTDIIKGNVEALKLVKTWLHLEVK